MFFIHGGGFRSGYSYEIYENGDAYGRNGVILIKFDYRLGCLGYMAHPLLTGESEHHASGNYGLLDQIAVAGKWYANIAAFGGDPDNITISGQSAGSVSVLNMVTLRRQRFEKILPRSCRAAAAHGGLLSIRTAGHRAHSDLRKAQKTVPVIYTTLIVTCRVMITSAHIIPLDLL